MQPEKREAEEGWPRFHISLQAQSDPAQTDRVLEIGGRRLIVLQWTQSVPAPLPSASFEMISESLAELPSLFIELDGSFTWGATCHDEKPWRLDGVIHDGREGVMSVEIKGRAAPSSWLRLLAQLRLVEETIVVVWLELGTMCCLAEFRRWISSLPSDATLSG